MLYGLGEVGHSQSQSALDKRMADLRLKLNELGLKPKAIKSKKIGYKR
jgi:hypothetical protein